MGHFHRILLAVVVGMVVAVLGAGPIGAGPASSSAYWDKRPDFSSQYSTTPCRTVNPNIIDMPLSAWLNVDQRLPAQRGRIDVRVIVSATAWGYDSHLTLGWRNLSSHKSGARRSVIHVRNGGSLQPGTHFRDLTTGPGRVRLTVTARNANALWMIPITCSDVFEVR